VLVKSPSVVESCTLQFHDLEPLLVNPQNGAKVSVQRSSETRRIVERVTLPRGLNLTFSRGGCEHLAYTYTFSGLSKIHGTASFDPGLGQRWPSPKKGRQVYELAVNLLGPIKIRKAYGNGPPSESAFLQAALLAGKTQSEYFDCGEPTCRVFVQDNDGVKSLVVSYDFPL